MHSLIFKMQHDGKDYFKVKVIKNYSTCPFFRIVVLTKHKSNPTKFANLNKFYFKRQGHSKVKIRFISTVYLEVLSQVLPFLYRNYEDNLFINNKVITNYSKIQAIYKNMTSMFNVIYELKSYSVISI